MRPAGSVFRVVMKRQSGPGAARDEGAKPYSALDDIPSLPPPEPDMVDVEPSGFDLIWDFVRSIFGRKPRDYAA